MSKNANKIYPFSIVISAALILFNLLVYKVSAALVDYCSLVTYCPKIPFIDDLFPIIPFFIIIYAGSFIFVFICGIITSKVSRQRYSDYIVGFFFAYLAGGILLVLFSARMDRVAEGIFVDNPNDIFTLLYQLFINYLDSGDIAVNLLPSFHALAVVYCVLGVAGSKEVSRPVQLVILLVCIAILFATLFVKQHYVLDLVAGSVLAFVSYFLARKFHWGKLVIPILQKYDGRDN